MTSTKSFYNRFAAVVLVMVMAVTSLFGVFPSGVFQELRAGAEDNVFFEVSDGGTVSVVSGEAGSVTSIATADTGAGYHFECWTSGNTIVSIDESFSPEESGTYTAHFSNSSHLILFVDHEECITAIGTNVSGGNVGTSIKMNKFGTEATSSFTYSNATKNRFTIQPKSDGYSIEARDYVDTSLNLLNFAQKISKVLYYNVNSSNTNSLDSIYSGDTEISNLYGTYRRFEVKVSPIEGNTIKVGFAKGEHGSIGRWTQMTATKDGYYIDYDNDTPTVEPDSDNETTYALKNWTFEYNSKTYVISSQYVDSTGKLIHDKLSEAIREAVEYSEEDGASETKISFADEGLRTQTANITLTANFEEKIATHTITYTADGNGTVSPPTNEYTTKNSFSSIDGSVATATNGYSFIGWIDAETGKVYTTDNEITAGHLSDLNDGADHTVTAKFVQNNVVIIKSSNPEWGYVRYGNSTLGNAYYIQEGILYGMSTTNGTRSPLTYNLTGIPNDKNEEYIAALKKTESMIVRLTNSDTTNNTFTPNAFEGYEFVGWEETSKKATFDDGTMVDASSITDKKVNSNKSVTITAKFKKIRVKYEAGTGGTVDGKTASASGEYEFVGWQVQGDDYSSYNNIDGYYSKSATLEPEKIQGLETVAENDDTVITVKAVFANPNAGKIKITYAVKGTGELTRYQDYFDPETLAGVKGSTAKNENKFAFWVDAGNDKVAGAGDKIVSFEPDFIPKGEQIKETTYVAVYYDIANAQRFLAVINGKGKLSVDGRSNYSNYSNNQQYYEVAFDYNSDGSVNNRKLTATVEDKNLGYIFDKWTFRNAEQTESTMIDTNGVVYVENKIIVNSSQIDLVRKNGLNIYTAYFTFPDRIVTYKTENPEYGKLVDPNDSTKTVESFDETLTREDYEEKEKTFAGATAVAVSDGYEFTGWKIIYGSDTTETLNEINVSDNYADKNSETFIPNTTFIINSDNVSKNADGKYKVTYVAQFALEGNGVDAEADRSQLALNEKNAKGYVRYNGTSGDSVEGRTGKNGFLLHEIEAVVTSKYFDFDRWVKVTSIALSEPKALAAIRSEKNISSHSIYDTTQSALIPTGFNSDGLVTSYDIIEEITFQTRTPKTDENGEILQDESGNIIYLTNEDGSLVMSDYASTNALLTTDIYFDEDTKIRAVFKQKENVIRIDYAANMTTPEGYYPAIMTITTDEDGTFTSPAYWTYRNAGTGDVVEYAIGYLNQPIVTEYIFENDTPKGCTAERNTYFNNDTSATGGNQVYRFIAWNKGHDYLKLDRGSNADRITGDKTPIVYAGNLYFVPWKSLYNGKTDDDGNKHTLFLADSRKTQNVYVAMRVNHNGYGAVGYNLRQDGTFGTVKTDSIININGDELVTNAVQAAPKDINLYKHTGWILNSRYISNDALEEWYDALDDETKSTLQTTAGNKIHNTAINCYLYYDYLQHKAEYETNEVNYCIAYFEPLTPFIMINYEIDDSDFGSIIEERSDDVWFIGNQTTDPQDEIDGGVALPINDYVIEYWTDPNGNIVGTGSEFIPRIDQLEAVKSSAVPKLQKSGEIFNTIVFTAHVSRIKTYNITYKTETDIIFGTEKGIKSNASAFGASAPNQEQHEFYCWVDETGRIVSFTESFVPSQWLLSKNGVPVSGIDNEYDVVFTAQYYYLPHVTGSVRLNKYLDDANGTQMIYATASFSLFNVQDDTRPIPLKDKGTENGSYSYSEVALGALEEVSTVDGTLTIDNLPEGNYYFMETKAPEGLAISQDKYYFVVKSNTTPEVKVYDKVSSHTLTIKKTLTEENYYSDFGEITFLYEIRGIGTAEQKKAIAQNRTPNEMVYISSLSFEDAGEQTTELIIPDGTYTIREIRVSRYEIENGIYTYIPDTNQPTKKQIINAYYTDKGSEADDDTITITADAKAEFVGILSDYSHFSDAGAKTNIVNSSQQAFGIKATYKKDVNDKDNDTLSINSTDLSQIVVLQPELISVDSDGTVTRKTGETPIDITSSAVTLSNINTSAAYAGTIQTLYIEYQQNGEVLRTTIPVKVEKLWTVTFDASEHGYFNYDTDSNAVVESGGTKRVETNTVNYQDGTTLNTNAHGKYISTPTYIQPTYQSLDNNPAYAYAIYEFKGWYAENDTLYTDSSTITQNVTLHAKYDKIPYTITYHLGEHSSYTDYPDGSITPITKSEYKHNLCKLIDDVDTYLMNFSTERNWVLVGWSTNENATEPDYAVGEAYPNADITRQNIDLYAVHKPSYVITFSSKVTGDATSGSAITGIMDEQEVLKDAGTVVLSRNKFAKKNYRFMGWDTDPTADEVVYTNNQEIDLSNLFDGVTEDNIILYPVFKKLVTKSHLTTM